MIPLEIRDLIDWVVHGVIQQTYQHFPQGLESRCAIYSIVGANCLKQITGDTYLPLCGGQWIPLRDGTQHFLCPSATEIQAANALQDLRNYHCWIQADKGANLEVVDLTLRHSDAACSLLGIAPQYRSEEPYAWVSMPAEGFGRAMPHEVCYYASLLRGHARLTELLNAFAIENRCAFDYLTRICLKHIHSGLVEIENALQ